MSNSTYSIDWSPTKIQAFRDTLLAWYDQEKRDLPWRQTTDPYAIWISEIMLQQTQVDTVIPYYERFMQELPTVADLAQVDDEQLMQLWQGLGYYSRARNLKIAANQIVADYHGQIPDSVTELLKLRGIGPYTAGAIASMAFGLPEPALDGNLMRIVTRLFALDDDISKAPSKRKFTEIYRQLIDPDRPGDFNQALMDMGATVMTASDPYPARHPLAAFDQSYQTNTAHLYPVNTSKIKQTTQNYQAFMIQNDQGAYLLRQHQSGELLQDLWHFPLVETEFIQESLDADQVEQNWSDWLAQHGLESSLQVNTSSLPTVKHVFSHRIWQVQPIQGQVADIDLTDHPAWAWVIPEEFDQYAFSTLQQKLIQTLFPQKGRAKNE